MNEFIAMVMLIVGIVAGALTGYLVIDNARDYFICKQGQYQTINPEDLTDEHFKCIKLIRRVEK